MAMVVVVVVVEAHLLKRCGSPGVYYIIQHSDFLFEFFPF